MNYPFLCIQNENRLVKYSKFQRKIQNFFMLAHNFRYLRICTERITGENCVLADFSCSCYNCEIKKTFF